MLYYLEKHLGGAEVFDPYLKAHVQKFAGQSINTQEWKDYLYEFMGERGKKELLDEVDWDTWLTGVGMVSLVTLFDGVFARSQS